jgi:hypothetical protein
MRLRIGAHLFRAAGLAGLTVAAAGIATVLWAGESIRELTQRPIAFLLGIVTCLALIRTGSQLRKRERAAAISALATFLWPVAATAASPGLLTAFGLAVCVAGATLIASTWKELD